MILKQVFLSSRHAAVRPRRDLGYQAQCRHRSLSVAQRLNEGQRRGDTWVFCGGMMFLFSEVWKKRLEISQVTTKRKNELYFEICFKQVNSEWMDGEALLP